MNSLVFISRNHFAYTRIQINKQQQKIKKKYNFFFRFLVNSKVNKEKKNQTWIKKEKKFNGNSTQNITENG